MASIFTYQKYFDKRKHDMFSHGTIYYVYRCAHGSGSYGVALVLGRLMVKVCLNKKIFIMIDGLDECSGNQTELIKPVHELAEDIPNLRLCLASYPYNNFEDAFQGRPSLLLQDLT